MLVLTNQTDSSDHNKVEFFDTLEELVQRLRQLRWKNFSVTTTEETMFSVLHEWRGVRFSPRGWQCLMQGYVPDFMAGTNLDSYVDSGEKHHVQIRNKNSIRTKFVRFVKPLTYTFEDLPKNNLID